MKAQNEEVMIITPESFKVHTMYSVKLCENFITSLLKTTCEIVTIKIDFINSIVECNDREIKNILFLYLKSKNFSLFYEQIRCFLHADNGHHKKLKTLSRAGKNKEFIVKEDSSDGYINWEVMLV